MNKHVEQITGDKAAGLSDFFKVFGDVTRIRILYALRNGDMYVSELADYLNMTQSAISHQLRLLKNMDLVRNTRDGKSIRYGLADDHIVTILDMGIEHIEEEK